MAATNREWSVFDAATPVLTFTYSFGPASANALAVGVEGGLAVVSPPRRAAAEAFDALRRYGPVRALVASNAFHHLGIPEWKARFPEAVVLAPAQSIARVERKSGLTGIRPLADAPALLGTRTEFIDMPHYRTGEVLVRTSTPRGRVWYVTDVIMNMPELPRHPLARVLFRVTRSAPGLRFNNVAPTFMVKDRKALRRWLAQEYAKAPPRWIIPAHGEIADLDVEREAARRLFAAKSQ